MVEWKRGQKGCIQIGIVDMQARVEGMEGKGYGAGALWGRGGPCYGLGIGQGGVEKGQRLRAWTPSIF